MSRNYVLNTGNGVTLFVGSNQNVGFHTARPSEKLTFEEGNAKFNSNVYVMKRMGVNMSNPVVELDVTGDAHVTGNMSVEGGIHINTPMSVNGFYVTRNSNYTLKTSLSAAVQNMDVNTGGTVFSITNTSQEFRFVATSNNTMLARLQGNGNMTLYSTLNMVGDIIPASNMIYNLGSSNFRFKDLYLSGNSIHMGGVNIGTDATSGSLTVKSETSGAPTAITVKELILQDQGQTFKLKNTGGQVKLVSVSNNVEATDATSTIPNLFSVSNNIGIGITQPTARLHVSDDALISSARIGSYPFDRTLAMFAHSNVNATMSYALMQSSNGDTFVNTGLARSIRFRVNNNDIATFNSAGRLGLGTTTPSEALDVTGNAKISSNTYIIGRLGVGTTSPSCSLHIQSTDALGLPSGTTAQRPTPAFIGQVRYNSTLNTFEGYGAGNTWGSLGGLVDTNKDTYIVAEPFPTSNDDTLRFVTSNIEVMRLTSNLLDLKGTANCASLTLQSMTIGMGDAAYPPPAVNVTNCNFTVSGQAYGNGTYNVLASSRIDPFQLEHQAFDQSMTTKWMSSEAYSVGTGAYTGSKLTLVGTSNYAGEWIQINMPQSIIPMRLKILASDSSTSNYSPKLFFLAGSKDAGTTWSSNLLSVQTTNWMLNLTSSNQANVFTIPTSTDTYNAFRLIINQTVSFDYAWIQYISIDGANLSTAPARLGIGTSNPIDSLHVAQGKIIAASNQILGYAGDTSIVPSFSWWDDSNTGMYHPSLNVIGFVNNGIESLRITSNGLLGVGTTTPTQMLDVNGSARVACNLEVVGNLTIRGVTTTLESTTINITDNMIRLNNGASYTSSLQAGIEINRGPSLSNYYFIFDESLNYFRVGQTGQLQTVATRDNVLPSTAIVVYDSDNRKMTGCNNLVYANNRLGVGTSNPFETLHVEGRTLFNGQIMGMSNDQPSMPSFSWMDDRLTGIYHPSLSNISLVTGGVERLRMTNNGNVGIGTIAPQQRLDIAGDVRIAHSQPTHMTLCNSSGSPSNAVFMEFNNSTATTRALLGVDGIGFGDISRGAMLMGTWTNNPLLIATNQAERMRITNAGNVGIGTTNPTFRLDVQGTAAFYSNVVGTSVLTNGSEIKFRNDTTTTHWSLFNSNTGGFQINNTSTNASLGTSGTNVVTLTTANNVGVGTTNPSFKLDVQGTSAFYASAVSTSLLTNGSELKFRSDGNTHWSIFNTNGVGLQINNTSTNAALGTTGSNVITISTANQVGVGLSNPSYRLHVSGDVYATNDVIAFSDKRFKEDVQPIKDPLGIVRSMNGCYYRKKGEAGRSIGFLAQDLQEVLPEVVRYDASNDVYGVSYANITAVLCEAIKALHEEVTVLRGLVV